MRDRDRREELRRRTGETLARLGREEGALRERRGEAPRPGDVFLQASTADLPVEWVLLGTDPADPRRLVAVPADTNPLAGSGDVLVPAEAPGGPLSLRCRYAVRVEPGDLVPELVTGAVEPAYAERALALWQALEAGTAVASASEREVDASPAYRDWIDEGPAPARDAVAAAGQGAAGEAPQGGEEPAASPAPRRPQRARRRDVPGSERTRGSWRTVWAPALAAVLLLAVVGLALRVVELERRIDDLAAPAFGPPIQEVNLDSHRGVEEILVPGGTDLLALQLVMGLESPAGTYRFEVLDREDRLLATTGDFEGGLYAARSLLLHREQLEAGAIRLRLLRVTGEGTELVEERWLKPVPE